VVFHLRMYCLSKHQPILHLLEGYTLLYLASASYTGATKISEPDMNLSSTSLVFSSFGKSKNNGRMMRIPFWQQISICFMMHVFILSLRKSRLLIVLRLSRQMTKLHSDHQFPPLHLQIACMAYDFHVAGILGRLRCIGTNV